MIDIDRLIADKVSAIARLKDEIRALRRARKIVESVSERPRARSGGAMKRMRSTKAERAPRGAKKAQVLSVMTLKPQRLRDIAEKAGVSTQEAASVLQNGLKRGEVKKGSSRGSYRLAGK
jgi:hypothetical protein